MSRAKFKILVTFPSSFNGTAFTSYSKISPRVVLALISTPLISFPASIAAPTALNSFILSLVKKWEKFTFLTSSNFIPMRSNNTGFISKISPLKLVKKM